MKHHYHLQNDVAVSSSEASASVATPAISPSSSNHALEKSMSVEHPSRDASSVALNTTAAAESVMVERRGNYSALCKWTIVNFQKLKSRALWSKYFEVGGFDCRLLIYPKGDSQALPGYLSIYLQIMDPRNTTSSKWDCFASYRLSIDNLSDSSKSMHRDSWHRFSSKKKSHGWCDFASLNHLLDPKFGFLHSANDSILIIADILILHESFSFSRDNYDLQATNFSNTGGGAMIGDVLSGKFTWKVHNFSLFKDMIKTQKIMSPVFPAGECNLRISVYQSVVNGVEYLSMCLESKDTEKNSMVSDRSCWCLFRMSVLNQKVGGGTNHVHRDSYGRFAADNKSGDNTSLGWNDYTRMEDFLGPESGFLVEDTAVFSTSFHVIKELSSFSKSGTLIGGKNGANTRKSDGFVGKFTWRIENFTRLKDLLKKRKITGLCIKSRRFQIGNRDCRLIVYPRGQSQPPCYLSVFLEVTDSRNVTSDCSCFVSHRLSVVNQKLEEKSVTKESQNRYSKAAKDWGWREFVTLTSLFDQDSGFLVQDTVIFSAEVLILKETSMMQEFTDQENDSGHVPSQLENVGKRGSFTWKVENFLSFKEIMETRKFFSKFFQAGGCELRIGVYESFDTICIYLESDQSVGCDPDKNFWVKYRMAIVNQKYASKTVWKESSICTKTWNNSVLQFMKVSDMLEADGGFLLRDTVVFVCEILDCCPWFEFSDLEVLASDDDQDALTTDPDELVDSDDSECLSGDEEEIFRNLLSTAGFHLSYGDNPSQPQVTLREKLLMDAGAIAGFLTGLRVYLDDPSKVKRLLLPTKISGGNDGKHMNMNDNSSPSLMNLLMGVKVLQQAIIDLLLDIMVECCHPSEESCSGNFAEASLKSSPVASGAISPLESEGENGVTESTQILINKRLELGTCETINVPAVQSSGINLINKCAKAALGRSKYPPETSPSSSSEVPLLQPNTTWPQQSEELLGLIVNSLRALDGAVPQGCPEPRRRPQSARKITLVLDKAPKHLQPDLVALVPKLVEHSEHPLAASALLDRLKKPDAEPGLRLPVFEALSQLECSSEVWERALFQSLDLLPDCNDEPLAVTVDFIFKAALHSQHLPEAVKSVRTRLKTLGTEVSTCVLDYLSRTVNSCADISESILRDIDCDDDFDHNYLPSELLIFGGSGPNPAKQTSGEEHVFRGSCHFSDIYLLIKMLSIPCLAIEAASTFERAVARGAFVSKSVAAVLERCLALRLNSTSQNIAENIQQPDVVTEGGAIEQLSVPQDDFTLLLGLAETLALSKHPLVKEFVKFLYTMLFKWYADEFYRLRMLKRLIDSAMTSADDRSEIELGLEILVILICQEQEIVRPVLSILRESVELANADRAALWHQLCVNEEEIIRIREESNAEVACISKEKSVISQKLSESEASNSCLKTEMRAEMDRFARERKEVTEQMHEVQSQLEWVRSERDDEVKKLVTEKKILQDRLYDAETQLSQLKSRKRDDLKRVMKEKNALTERLKSAEAARKRFGEELKRFATDNVTREEIRQSLEDEVRRLTQTVGQTKGEKRKKEEQVARCETYIDGLESKLQACEQYIHHLETQVKEEMSRHAPLYGAGLEALSMKELDTISHIHEEGLRQIHAIQQCKGNQASTPLVSPHTLSHTPQVAVGLPPRFTPNGVGIHNNGNLNGEVRRWFDQ
ncbi:LOW QUALITY PROTEIN: uncharacterized protein LOC142543108 [Primulina tabacum]|uniref:LOW QUALITY PROTEIN: uncharacterized protein LOC142543108 n=1 Tax=Primulina tabacum TaxID=48773 RepID=UPI003F592378